MPGLRGTLSFPQAVNPHEDAERIDNACKGLGTNENVITDILAHRSIIQRDEIRRAYEEKYGKDMISLLASELTGEYESLVKDLFRFPMELLAHDIHKKLKGKGSPNHVLTCILCCCSNSEIHLLKKAYANYASHRSLETDVLKRAKGPFGMLLGEVLKAERYEDTPEELDLARQSGDIGRLIDRGLVDQDVKDLHSALESQEVSKGPCAKPKGKGDPKVFISILTKRSRIHMREIWEMYKKLHGMSLVEAVVENFSEPFRTAMNTIIMSQIDLRLLLVCQMYEAMAGLGTDEDTLIRIICLHAEHDLQTMIEDYNEYFEEDFHEAVRSDTSGDFRKLLMELLQG